jgi:hypothetical protein
MVATSVNSQLDVNGVEEMTQENAEVTVYPNPFNEVLNVRSNEIPSRVQLSDNCGHLVFSAEKTNAVNVQGLAPGIYFMTVFSNGNNPAVFTVVKTR